MDLRYLFDIGLPVSAKSVDTGATRGREPGSEGIAAPGSAKIGHSVLVQQPSYDFDGWLRQEIAAGVVGSQFRQTCARVAAAACGWRSRFPGHLWARLARDSCSTLIKEAREAVPVIAFVQERVAALDASDGPITILDLCSGLGFLGMLLGEILPRERVDACILMDQAWPLKGGPREVASGEAEPAKDGKSGSRRNRTRLNWDHIYGLPWPVTLTTRRSDLKLPSTHAQILTRILEPAPGPVFILGIHLCGILSIRAVETFNRGPKCVGLVLKPCCLPAMEYVKSQTRWTLGAHSFDASEVCMWGKYNKNQWQGPVKATLAPRFNSWAENLYRGICADRKQYGRIPLVEGHYQDAYLLAERAFSSCPPPPCGPEDSTEALVNQVLGAETPDDVLGVPEGVSMRALHRRWAALTKSLGKVEDHPGGPAAFKRVKEAYDEIRARRPKQSEEIADVASPSHRL